MQVRFWSKVRVRGLDECWPWIGPLSNGGYPRLSKIGNQGGAIYADTYCYELHYGPLPPKTGVDHTCLDRRCVNPHHLAASSEPTCGRVPVGPPPAPVSEQVVDAAIEEAFANLSKSDVTQIPKPTNLYSTKRGNAPDDDAAEPKTPIRTRMTEERRRTSIKALGIQQLRNLIQTGYKVAAPEKATQQELVELLLDIEFRREEGNV